MRKSPKTDVRRRISFEKKVAVQALVSLLVLIYGIMASKTNIAPQHKAFIHRAVNVTSDKNDIIDMVYTARDLSEKAVSTCGEYFDRLVQGHQHRPVSNRTYSAFQPGDVYRCI